MSNDIKLENEIENLISRSPRGRAIRVLPAELESELTFAFRKLARNKLETEANASAAFQPDEFRDRLRARVAGITHDCMRLFDRVMQGVATEGGSSGVGSSCLCLRGWIESEIKEAAGTKIENLVHVRQQPPMNVSHVQQGTENHCTAGESTAGESTAGLRAQYDTSAKKDSKERPKAHKGDVALIAGKRIVNFKVAEQYLGISGRHRQNLIKSKVLRVEGKGQNGRITTESLKAYLPSENPN